MIMKKFSVYEVFEDFISLFFPRMCFHCNKPLVYQEEILCINCRWTMPETNFHLDQENPVYQKFVYENRVKFASAYLFYHRKGIAQKLIHTMKYRNIPQIGRSLGKWYGEKLLESKIEGEFLIPVPLHKNKLSARGFNQSETICEGLAQSLKIPVDTQSIVRVSNTSTQTKKAKVDRWVNVNSVFKVVSSENIAGRKVILVDDVLTTGATMGVLIDEVVKAGARTISVLTIAAGV